MAFIFILITTTTPDSEIKPQPRFLSEEERAQFAIAKRAQEIREGSERRETARRDRDALERGADELAQRERNKSIVFYGAPSLSPPRQGKNSA